MQNLIGKQIDRYQIIEQVGQGGMAVVYKAYDVRLEREVALKLIRQGAIPLKHQARIMQRFQREAKVQAGFSHEHIVPVYNYGEFEGSPYLVMKYIAGGTLKEKTGKPIAVKTALNWIIKIADALSYAHGLGVIHRDVKPGNIMLNEELEPCLTDFGIAKILEENDMNLTGLGMGVGTPEYMAPEQWKGQAEKESDQYALGVVLYELLTGKKPYTAETPMAIALKQMREALPSPRVLVADMPEALESVLLKMLSINPQDRFKNMEQCKQALIHCLDGDICDLSADILPEYLSQGQDNVNDLREAETFDELSPIQIGVETSDKNNELLNEQTGRKKSNKKPEFAWLFIILLPVLIILAYINRGYWLPLIKFREKTQIIVSVAKETTNTVTTTSTPTLMREIVVTPTQTIVPSETPTELPPTEVEPVVARKDIFIDENAIKKYDFESGEINELMEIDPCGAKNCSGNSFISRDCQYVLYAPLSSITGTRDYYSGLYLYDLKNLKTHQITEKTAYYTYSNWSENNRFVFFISDMDGLPGLFLFDIETYELSPVIYWEGTTWGIDTSWDLTSQKLYIAIRGVDVIRQYDVNSGKMEEIANISDVESMRISPNKDSLLISSATAFHIIDIESREIQVVYKNEKKKYPYYNFFWLDEMTIIGGWYESRSYDASDYGVFFISLEDYSLSHQIIEFPEGIYPDTLVTVQNGNIFFQDYFGFSLILVSLDDFSIVNKLSVGEDFALGWSDFGTMLSTKNKTYLLDLNDFTISEIKLGIELGFGSNASCSFYEEIK